MNYFLIYILVVIVFVHNQCDTSPVHSGQDFSFNSIDDRPYSQTKAKSKSSDNSVKSGRTEIKKKTCGQILIETLPMICQHSSDLIETDNDLEYSGNYQCNRCSVGCCQFIFYSQTSYLLYLVFYLRKG